MRKFKFNRGNLYTGLRNLSSEKYHWLPRALSYFADEEVRNYGMIDRVAGSINPNVALSAIYDAMRYLLTVINSNEEERKRFVSKFGKVERIEGDYYYCFQGNCPSVCKEVEGKCCCNAKALYELAMREVEKLKYDIKEFKPNVLLDLKVIAINALG